MAQGSNELNALLSARVVKIKVELDLKGSNLAGQVNGITTLLKDKPVKLKVELLQTGILSQVDAINKMLATADKKVKLKVELSGTANQLNGQIKTLTNQMKKDKALEPFKIGVEIDVKGSADAIKKQLDDIQKTVKDFNNKYGSQIKKMQEHTAKATQQAKAQMTNVNIPTNGGVENYNNIKNYVKQLEEAERIMKKKIPSNEKGIFSSFEMKDAKGNLQGFIATLERANGVVDKVKYAWNADKNKFMVMDRTTATQTEKLMFKQMQSLKDLEVSLSKTGDKASKFKEEYNQLMNAGANKSLTSEMVNDYKRKINQEIESINNMKSENSALTEQKKLLSDINRLKKRNIDSEASGKLGNLQSGLKDVNVANPMAKNEIAEIKRQFGDIKKGYEDQVKQEKDLATAQKKRLEVLAEIGRLEKSKTLKTGDKDSMSKGYVEETKKLANQIKTMEDWIVVRKRMDSTNNEKKSLNIDSNIENQLTKLKKAMVDYANATNLSQSEIEERFDQVSHSVRKNLQLATEEVKRWQNLLTDFNLKQDIENKRRNVVGITPEKHKEALSLVSTRDNEALKEYVSNLNNAKVAMLSLSTADGVSKIKAQFESSGKMAKELTYEISEVDGLLRQVGERDVFNANRNLGVFEQLKIAMARVPVWMTAMTAFYGSINGVKAMTQEILKLDTALTELRRVASDNLSIDTVFQGSIQLSKELGNNVHDVMQSINDMARTFGDFNERQLLAITKTATLMSNVSDLTAQEASNNLVGTMNAFNISAEESIHIVDALNEVDNNYAISTKQLSEGLSKSASTAKTFGVTMEENVGHITAVGAVTMESGAIIGNSLKTIYSRITTMNDAKDVLESVGVEMKDQAGDARNVSEILTDLSGRWNDLSKEERQNIAVKVAGRYQLSRFLALMNNFQTSVEATDTAVNSQGSAMRENAEYLKSFEARINSLKNGFTELSNAVGEAILSDGMMGVIGLLKGMTEAGVAVANTFGALPAVLIPVALLMGKMGMFTGLINDISKLSTISKAFKTALAGTETVQAVGRVQALRTAFNGVAVAEGKASLGAKLFGFSLKSALIGTGIGVAIVALGFAFEKLVGYIANQKAKQEQLELSTKKMVDGYRQHKNGLDEMIARYDELNNMTNKSTKEQEEFNKIQKTLAENLPTTVEYIDANGKAHMKNTDEIKKEVEAVAELSREQAKLDQLKFDKNLEKQAKSYTKVTDKVKDLYKEQEKLVEQNGKKGFNTTKDAVGETTHTFGTVDNSKAIQENKIEILMAEAEKTEALKKTIKQIQSQTLAYFEANGDMKALGDEQQGVIENFIQYNEAVLRNADNFEDAYLHLNNVGKEVGQVFVDAYASLTEGVPDDPLKLEPIKEQLDSVAKTIPQSFYSMTDASGNMVKSSDDIVNGLKEIVNVSTQVGGASADQTGEFVYRLQQAGLSAQDAKSYLLNLANESDNLAIKQELASQGIDATTNSLAEFNQEALETIDMTEQLFGYTSGDIKGIKDYLNTMHLIVDTHGELGKTTEEYINAQSKLADFLGVTATELENNQDKYYFLADALGKLNLAEYDNQSTWQEFIKDNEDLTESQKDVLLSWNGTKDIITGVNQHLEDSNNKTKESAKETKKQIEDIFDVTLPELPPIDFTQVLGSVNYVKSDVDALTSKLETLGIKIGTPTGDAITDSLMKGLQITDGKIENTETNITILRNAINRALGGETFLDDANKKTDKTKGKAKEAEKAVNTLKDSVKTPVGGAPFLNPVDKAIDNTSTKVGTLGTDYEKTIGMFNTPAPIKVNLWENQQKAMGTTVTVANKTNKEVATANTKMAVDFEKASDRVVKQTKTMSSEMHKAFSDNTKKIAKSAGNIPKQIGDAIRKNMSDATDSMDALAKDMVKRFKSELGIHSPSRVFTKLGGHVIEGLVNGLNGGNLKNLGKSVFEDFGGGALDSWDMIKAYLTDDFGNMAGGSADSWKTVASKALMMTGQFSESNLARLLMQMQTESSGNPKAINLWDSNAQKGTPSKGLMQVIDPTFKSYAMSGFNTDIYDPLSNIIASIRYAVSRYGSLSKAYKGHGYAKGGIVSEKELAWHGEEGAEAIIPLIPKRRKRGLELWEEAGSRLGISPSVLGWLKQYLGKSSGGQSYAGVSSFGAMSGEGGGDSGGGDSGTSGTLIPSSPTLTGMRTFDGGYEFSALAYVHDSKYDVRVPEKDSSKSKKKKEDAEADAKRKKKKAEEKTDAKDSEKNSKAKEKENLAEAFSYNKLERAVNSYDTTISILSSNLEGMDKTSAKYRDTLKQIIALENKKIATEQRDLANTKKQNVEIQKKLDKLPAISKQSSSQRETYNKLMQDYDSNLTKINSLSTSIASQAQEIKAKSAEVFSNFIDEIVETYDKAINTIKSKIDNTDFEISVMELTNPDNKKGLMNLQVQKANLAQQEQATQQDKYNKVVREEGKNTSKAKADKKILDAEIANQKKFNAKDNKAVKDAKAYYDKMAKKYNPSSQHVVKAKKAYEEAVAKDKRNEGITGRKVQSAKDVYNATVTSQGAKSEKAIAEKGNLNDSILATLNAEKAIKDMRLDVAEDGIKALKDYYGEMKGMATEAIDLEMDARKEAFETKMDEYDAEKKALQDNYDLSTKAHDKRIKEINDEYDLKFKKIEEDKSASDYEDGKDERQLKVTKLVNKISLLSRDTTLEGKKKLAELQSQLADASKELDDFQNDRQDELLKQGLNNQKETQINSIEATKETEKETLDIAISAIDTKKEEEKIAHEKTLKSLEDEKVAVAKKYEDMINNEKLWAKIRDDAQKGSFTALNTSMTEMGLNIELMQNGIFTGLSAGFANLSEEVKKHVEEINALSVENLGIEVNSSSKAVSSLNNAKSYTMTNGDVDKSKASKVTVPTVSTPKTSTSKTSTSTSKTSTSTNKTSTSTTKKTTPIKVEDKADRKITSSVSFRSQPAYGNNIISTLPKDAKVDYVGMEKGWAKIKYKGKTGYVGSSFLKKFKTGGYTGDNVPKDGAMAILHNKELVLNERQTSDILDTAKIMDKMKSILPNIKKNTLASQMEVSGSINANGSTYNLNVNIEKVTGDKEGANVVIKEVMKSLKKLGK